MTTVPKPATEKARSTCSRVGRSAPARSTVSATRASAARSSSSPSPVFAAHADDLGVRRELARLLLRQRRRLGVDGVDLRERDDAALDPQEPQDREVLVRLGTRALDPRRRRAGRDRSRSLRRPSCGRTARAPARRRPTAVDRPAARAARSRGRSRSPAAAPREGGRCLCPSAPARATSCRDRCGPQCRPSTACQRRLTSRRHGLSSQSP